MPGFTLVESLIACVVLALSVSAIASMLMAATMNARMMQTDAVMTDTARRSMEYLSAQSLATLPPGPVPGGTTTVDITTRLPSTQPSSIITDTSGAVVADETPRVTVSAQLDFVSRTVAPPDNSLGIVSTTVIDATGRKISFKRLVTSVQVDQP